MPIHNGTEWKKEKAWWVKVGGTWKKSTTIWKRVSGVWEKMTLSIVGLVSTLAGSGTAGDSNGIGSAAQFDGPTGIDIDSGFAYVCDTLNHCIRKINLTTAEVSTFAGSGNSGSDDGIGVLAEFNQPSFLSIYSGFAYITDIGDRKIRKINLTTAEVSTFAGSGNSGSTDGIGVLAEFKSPTGIDIDSGFAYVCDQSGNTIRKINLTTAEVSTFAGSGSSDDFNGIGVLAGFRNPTGICIDSDFAYVCDQSNNKIRKIDLTTAEVTTLAGSGTGGSDDGAGVLAEFKSPFGVSIYSGFAYITDLLNNRVRAIDLSTAEVTTFSGSGTAGSADGVGVLAEFDLPAGIKIDSALAYICDSSGNKIRTVTL